MKAIENTIMLCLAICAHDGLVSKSEEQKIFDLAFAENNIDLDSFNLLVDKFFESTDSLETILSTVSDKNKALYWAEEAASADGLDVKENIALQRCHQLVNDLSDLGKKNG